MILYAKQIKYVFQSRQILFMAELGIFIDRLMLILKRKKTERWMKDKSN